MAKYFDQVEQKHSISTHVHVVSFQLRDSEVGDVKLVCPTFPCPGKGFDVVHRESHQTCREKAWEREGQQKTKNRNHNSIRFLQYGAVNEPLGVNKDDGHLCILWNEALTVRVLSTTSLILGIKSSETERSKMCIGSTANPLIMPNAGMYSKVDAPPSRTN